MVSSRGYFAKNIITDLDGQYEFPHVSLMFPDMKAYRCSIVLQHDSQDLGHFHRFINTKTYDKMEISKTHHIERLHF